MTQTPQGWYPVDGGQERYWDGAAWTDQVRPSAPPAPPVPSGAPAPAKKKRKIFLWFFLAIQVLFIIWIIAGASTGSGQPDDCGVLDAETCNDAADTGTAIGVVLIIVFWMVVDVILGVIYGVYRLAKRSD
ncbi:hypothetical protein ABIE44_002808 [Marmoricola sp. OAE513]|uniref:DUF2510 domain-containing protein n=1 Tax=Marmoricola sp. OAE513 TaxID=2817894 RepID=UPI001AE49861